MMGQAPSTAPMREESNKKSRKSSSTSSGTGNRENGRYCLAQERKHCTARHLDRIVNFRPGKCFQHVFTVNRCKMNTTILLTIRCMRITVLSLEDPCKIWENRQVRVKSLRKTESSGYERPELITSRSDWLP